MLHLDSIKALKVKVYCSTFSFFDLRFQQIVHKVSMSNLLQSNVKVIL